MGTRTAGPLSGITVVEVGIFMAAPFATMQLADLGARVIKVERPDEGEPTRLSGPFVDGESSPFMRLNRNKESLALDLKTDAGQAAFKKLAARADVLVENFRPGALRRLGLGYEDLSADHPELIYASGSGWGQTGSMAAVAGLDIMAQARSGLMSITGHPDMPPAKVGVPICDLTTALYIALAITAAIHERERSGVGQYIDVSLFESGVSYAVWEAGAYFVTGAVGGPNGSAHQNQAPYQAVTCKDGYVTIGANTPRNWAALCRALDLAGLPADARFADVNNRLKNREALIGIIESTTRTLTTDELLDRLTGAGVPCAPISDYGQVFTDETLAERGFFWDSEHPSAGTVRQLGSPMRFSRTPTVRGAAGPLLGSGNRRILSELGYAGDALEALCTDGAESKQAAHKTAVSATTGVR